MAITFLHTNNAYLILINFVILLWHNVMVF